MDGARGRPKRVEGLAGRVVRDPFARGTKSERSAIWLETARERFLLRRKGGPSYDDRVLSRYVGRSITCDGFLVDDQILAERIEISEKKENPMASRRSGRSRKSSGTSRRKTPARRAAAVPESGPVTLEEARALARARRPKRAGAALRSAARPPTPERVGRERERLEEKREEEIARRTAEYKATMSIMKRRGARRPEARGAGAAGPAAAVPKSSRFEPLRVFAEGDSWFEYPVPLFGGGIVKRLEKRIGVPILNLAKAGDEVRYMLGVRDRLLLSRHLEKGCPAGGKWDALLFSGGGNDIVDHPMALWIDDWDPSRPPAAHIHPQRFGAALALVRAGYEDLIALRNQLSPSTHLVLHAYDYALPDGRGICHLGPWLQPTFKLKRFPTQAAAFEVVKAMLEQFADLLTDLARTPGVTFINGQGTLPAVKNSWHNELHPSKRGYDVMADLFHQELKRLFPSRVA